MNSKIIPLIALLYLSPALAVDYKGAYDSVDKQKASDSVDKDKMGEAVSTDGIDYQKAADSVDKQKATDSVDLTARCQIKLHYCGYLLTLSWPAKTSHTAKTKTAARRPQYELLLPATFGHS
jgi:hypothetical protein